MTKVSKEEFDNFIINYPRPLVKDLYMDWISWNDFSFGNFPDSVVAMMSCYPPQYPVEYKIEDIENKIQERNRKIHENLKRITKYQNTICFDVIRQTKTMRLPTSPTSDGLWITSKNCRSAFYGLYRERGIL